jgi:hypothetical protein
MKRLPIIRHVRWFILHARFMQWWFSVGRHYWLVPNDEDMQYLEDVWNGKR